MSDSREVINGALEPPFRIPVLLQFLGRYSVSEGAVVSSATLAEKARVMSNLITKYLKLDNLAGTLQGVLGQTSDPEAYDDVALRLAETRAEQSLCKARYDAIDADQPFSNPGPEAEDALLAAIHAVDLATQNTAAVAALLEAAHQLISAYAAKSTKAA